MSDYIKGVWYRENDLLFILEHAGWGNRGKEELRNRIMVRVEARRDVPKEEAEALTAMIHDILTSYQAVRDKAIATATGSGAA